MKFTFMKATFFLLLFTTIFSILIALINRSDTKIKHLKQINFQHKLAQKLSFLSQDSNRTQVRQQRVERPRNQTFVFDFQNQKYDQEKVYQWYLQKDHRYRQLVLNLGYQNVSTLLSFFKFSLDKPLVAEFNESSPVTMVVTSNKRLFLLQVTLMSFFQVNSYPIAKIIIIDDSANVTREQIESCCVPLKYRKYVDIVINKERLGQIRSIDKAFSLVKTEYVYQTEDDYVFFKDPLIK